MGKAGVGLLVFLLSFFWGLSSCTAQQQSGADFYEGLKKRQAGAQKENLASAAAHFEKALDNANPVIVAAAAAELMSMHFAGMEFSEAKMAVIREKAVGSWARAIDAVESIPSESAPSAEAVPSVEAKAKTLALLLGGENRSFGEPEQYVLQKWRIRSDEGKTAETAADAEADPNAAAATGIGAATNAVANANGDFTEAERAMIDGRFAVSRFRYTEALIFFRIALNDSPELFFRYPHLLADLGSTFQYAATGKEGQELFLKWEKLLSDGENAEGLPETAAVAKMAATAAREFIPADSENLVRFYLLFFAARIARQRGDSASAIELFEEALPFARKVSPEQADACIWYILDTSLTSGSSGADRTIRYLETYIPQWHNDVYFSDVLDKLTREFVFRRQWENVLKMYTLLKDCPDATKHAWIISRAIEEKLFSPSAPATEYAAVYMRRAYEASNNAARIGNSGWYYRSLSAASLNLPFLELPETAVTVEQAPPLSDTMQFLLGFFENDATQFAYRYIRAEENSLAPEELYLLAEAQNKAGQYQESMRLVSLYTRKNGYQVTRKDLEMLYPRPFKELVEQYAEETGIEPALLFGLIRTESAFNSGVVSRAGAIGLTQLMPATAKEAAVRIHRRGGTNYTAEGSAPDLYDPAVNIHIGASYLAFLNERMEDPMLALLSYNGGMNRVRRWRRGTAANLPTDLFMETVEYSETRNYGRNVLGAAAMYRNLY